MGKSSSMWALLLLFSCVLAGPIQQNTCSTECRSPALNPKFRYAAGQTYTYNFQANSRTWMMGTSDDKALLEVKGQALVTFRAPCDAVLQLRQITISGLDEKVDASELQKRPLSFSWQDGTVDSLCPEQDEPVWVVNIKRSVLSMLQHTAQFVDVNESHVIESDVIGRCPTEYAVEGTGKEIKVIKTKIPNQCSHRIDRQSSIPTVAYHVPAETQTIPLMNSTSVCEQQIKDNVIKSVECRETHLFRPLSTEQGGARTDVTSSISLISTTNAADIKLSSNRVPKTLILDPRGVQLEFQDAKDVNTVVRAICQHLDSDSPARVSQLFTELVHSLRKASAKEVKAAWNNLRGKKICPEAAKTEKLFLDALPQAGSTGTITVMVDILKENKLSSRQALGWYLSLPLSKFASLEAIKAVLPLVDGASNSPVALLGLTGLARRYCAKNIEECQSSADVLQFSTKLSKMLGNKCRVDAKSEVKVISVLKALGNLGVMTPEVHSTVSECAKDASLPATIRLAAIEATRNSPCTKQVKNNLLTILEDRKEDAEIRIAAYQGVMRCPDSPSVVRIQQVLQSEETNQVVSYIISHLNNIKSNPTPGKENARNLVKKLNLARSFPHDLRKYSVNMAVADFCPINNAGWDIDSNIVYSPKSFIPRSASVNLTLDLFGQSVNLFEFGVRSENLERLLEAYLGPNGVVDKEGVAGLLEKTSDSVSQFGENVWNRLASATRSKRASIKVNELSNLDKLMSMNMKEKTAGIKLDAFLRVFGSEIGMMNYRFSSGAQPRLDSMADHLQSQIAEAWRDLIEGAKRVNVEVARSMMFMDSSATFPTIAGFPLRLAVNGTSTLGLGLESQMDIPALLRDPLNANIKLKVNPLAVTEVSASMTVDIAVAKTGIKMAATVHSSMAADFSAQLLQGKTVEVKLDLPKSKMTLVEFKSSVLLIQQNADKSESNKPIKILNEATYSRGGCSERLSFITGMRLCATSSVSIPRPAHDPFTDPTPAFPLSGSTNFAIVLEKTEPSMKGYLLSMTATQESPKATSFLMQVNTPGSKTNRKISIKGTMTSAPTLTIKVDTQAPWGNLAAEAELVNNAAVKSVMMKIITQDKREFYGKAQVNVVQGDRKYSLATTLEAGWPKQPRAVILEGGFGHEIGRSFQVSLKPSGPFAKLPYGFQVTLGREFSATVQKVWLTNFQLLTPLGSALLSTEIGRQDRNYVAALNMKYGTEQKMHAVSFNGQVQSLPQPAERTVAYKTAVVYKSTRFPTMNIDLKLDVQASPTMLSNVLILVHGPETEHSTNRLYINKFSQLKGSLATKDFTFENKLELTYPRYALNIKADQALKIDGRLVKGTANLHLDNIKLFETDLALVLAPKDPKNFYELSFKMAYPGLTITLVDTAKKIDRNSFSMSPVLEFQPGRKIEMMGKASLINDQNGLSVDMNSEMRISGFSSPIKVRHSFQYTGDAMATTNKIEWAGQPQLVLEGKISPRARSLPAVELVFLWNGRVDAKMDARLSRDESLLDLDLNLIRLQRRVKVVSQHKLVGDSRSASINVAWDANRDANKQFGLDGTLTLSRSQRLVDIKSTLNIENRLYSMAINGKLGADFLNGDHLLRLEVQVPAMKKMLLNILMSNLYQAKEISNRLEVESQLISGLYQVSVNNVVKDLDRNAYTYSALTELSVKKNNVEEIKWRMDSKRTVRSDKRNVDFKSLMIAPKWGQNIDTSVSAEVTKSSFRAGSKFQRGPMLITLDSAGKLTRQDGKINVDGFIELKAPKTSLPQTKIAVVSSYEITSISNFDLNEKITIEYQPSKVITLDSKLKVSPSTVDFSTMLETPFQVARRQGLTISGRFEPTNPRKEGSMVITWSSPNSRQPQEARIDIEVEQRPGQLSFKLVTATPIRGFETSELSFDLRLLEDGKINEIDVVVGLSEKKAKLNGRLNLSPSQREIDLTLSMPNNNPMRFIARVGSQAPTHTVETRVDWGTGTFAVEGSTKFISSDNFDVNMKVHSPELGINNYEIKGSNKLQNKQRTIELTVMKKSMTLAVLKSVYDRKEDRTGSQITGSATVSLPESQTSGTFKYSAEGRMVDSNDESGLLYKMEVDLSFGDLTLNKLNGHIKWTNKEKSASLGACIEKGACFERSVAYKDTGIKPAVAKEIYVFSKVKTVNGVQDNQGLRIKHISSATKFEHTTEVIFDEARNSVVGYKAYKKDNEYGLEVFTPKRTGAATFEIARGSRLSSKTQFILTVWLDKTKAPERKLVIVTSVDPHKMGDMEGLTTSTLIKHPMLPKDLEYKLDFHTGKNGRDIFHFKLDADVMDPKHQRWSLETNVKNLLTENNGRNITIDMELRSKGADVAALLSLYGGSSASHLYTVGANLKLKEKERIQKELFARVDAAPQKASLSFGSPAKQMTLEGRWSVDEIVNYKRLQLSASTRLFGLSPTVYVLDMNTSPHIDIRVFSKGASENYHQLVGGLVDETHFELALIRQLNVQKKELAAVYVALNSTDRLSTRLTWKLDDLRGLLAAVRSRSQAIAKEMQTVRSSLATELGAIAPKWRSFANLRSSYEKLAADYSNQLEQMRKEIKEDESLMEFFELMEHVAQGIKYLGEAVEGAFDQFDNQGSIFDIIENIVDKISERLTKLVSSVGEMTSKVLEDIVRIFEQWKFQYGQKDGLIAAIRNYYDANCKQISGYIAEITSVLEQPIRRVVTWVQSLKIGERNLLVSLKEAIENANMDALRERIANLLDEIVLLPSDEFLTELANAYPETTRSVYRYGKLPIRRIRYYLRRTNMITGNRIQVAQKNDSDMGSYLSSLIGELVVYDVKNGEIRYVLPLRNKVSSLRDLWQSVGGRYSQLKGLAASSSLRDMYRELRAKYDPTLASARVNGHASLIGSKGIVTFDKKSFDLSGGSCQYLLARDFLNMDFAVAVNFEQSSEERIKKSVIFTDGDEQVEIKDEQVLINNKPASLPAKLKAITVNRHENVVVVKLSSGVVLRCDVNKDVCSLELSPFYAGRTMGLWGNFNNEQVDDLTESSGKITKDFTSFINSWKINKSCKDNIQTVPDFRLVEPSVYADECSNLFVDKDSELKSCFRVVSPAPYNDLCLKFALKKKSESAFERQLDSLVAGYRAACQRSDVSL